MCEIYENDCIKKLDDFERLMDHYTNLGVDLFDFDDLHFNQISPAIDEFNFVQSRNI